MTRTYVRELLSGGYTAACIPHGYALELPDQATAELAAARVHEWCRDCRMERALRPGGLTVAHLAGALTQIAGRQVEPAEVVAALRAIAEPPSPPPQ